MIARCYPPLDAFYVQHLPAEHLARVAADLSREAKRASSPLLARKLTERADELRRQWRAVCR